MPGWGSWSSNSPLTAASATKKMAAAKKVHKPGLVMKDGKQELANHQLPSVPHPFRNLDDCQADLATPIGDTFMPKTSVIKSTKPRVHVKLGAYLEAEAKEEI